MKKQKKLRTYNVLWTHGHYGDTFAIEAESEEEARKIMHHWLYHVRGINPRKMAVPHIFVLGEHNEGDSLLGSEFRPLHYPEDKTTWGRIWEQEIDK